MYELSMSQSKGFTKNMSEQFVEVLCEEDETALSKCEFCGCDGTHHSEEYFAGEYNL